MNEGHRYGTDEGRQVLLVPGLTVGVGVDNLTRQGMDGDESLKEGKRSAVGSSQRPSLSCLDFIVPAEDAPPKLDPGVVRGWCEGRRNLLRLIRGVGVAVRKKLRATACMSLPDLTDGERGHP